MQTHLTHPRWLALALACGLPSCGGAAEGAGRTSGLAEEAAAAPEAAAVSPVPPLPPAAPGVFASTEDVPAPSLASPAEDARTGCGALGSLPLGAELPLLDERLWVRPLEGAYAQPRAWNVMGAPEPERGESRLYFEADDEKMVIMAYELFATAGADIVARVREEQARHFPNDDLQRTDVLGEGVEALRLVPRELDTSGEAVRVLTLFVISNDRALQVLSFYVNPRAAEGGRAACLGLALRSARTLRAGARTLEAGGTHQLWAGSRTLHVTLPPRGVVLTQPGPDFVVHRVFELLPLGSRRVSGFIYFGGHPVSIRVTSDTFERDIFGLTGHFYRIPNEDGSTRLEVMQGIGDDLYTHVQLTVPAGSSPDAWLAAYSAARLVP